MDDVGLDRQIVVNEIGGEGVVGVNAADLGGGEDDGVGPVLLQPNFDGDLIAQIDDGAVDFQHLIAATLQIPRDRRSHHALMARDPNSSFSHDNTPWLHK